MSPRSTLLVVSIAIAAADCTTIVPCTEGASGPCVQENSDRADFSVPDLSARTDATEIRDAADATTPSGDASLADTPPADSMPDALDRDDASADAGDGGALNTDALADASDLLNVGTQDLALPCTCTLGSVRACDACAEQSCEDGCRWASCRLKPGSACRDGERRPCQNPGVCSSSQTCSNCQWPTYCCG